MNNRHIQLFVLAVIALLLTGCAGMTAAETVGVAVTGAGALVGFVQALSPMLSPEDAAQLTMLAGDVQTVVDASAAAMGALAQSIADLKAEQAAQDAGALTSGEKGIILTGVTAAGVGISREMSRRKHAKT
jgi:hypothetical protein